MESVSAGQSNLTEQQKEKLDQVIKPPAQKVPNSAPDKKCFIKVVAIGDSGVGKTSLIQMFEQSKFTDNFKPTIGADFSNKEVLIDGKVVTL